MKAKSNMDTFKINKPRVPYKFLYSNFKRGFLIPRVRWVVKPWWDELILPFLVVLKIEHRWTILNSD